MLRPPYGVERLSPRAVKKADESKCADNEQRPLQYFGACGVRLQMVEHEALVTVMAERARVAVPHVGQLVKAGDGSVLLTMELIAGQPLDEIPDESITEPSLRTPPIYRSDREHLLFPIRGRRSRPGEGAIAGCRS